MMVTEGGPLPWEVDKSSYVIRFVEEAEDFLDQLPKAVFAWEVQNRHNQIREYVASLKSGACTMEYGDTFKSYLDSLDAIQDEGGVFSS
jgi:chemotaxis protein histidine kinase CheA